MQQPPILHHLASGGYSLVFVSSLWPDKVVKVSVNPVNELFCHYLNRKPQAGFPWVCEVPDSVKEQHILAPNTRSISGNLADLWQGLEERADWVLEKPWYVMPYYNSINLCGSNGLKKQIHKVEKEARSDCENLEVVTELIKKHISSNYLYPGTLETLSELDDYLATTDAMLDICPFEGNVMLDSNQKLVFVDPFA